MQVALAYGVAVLLSGWFLAQGVESTDRARWRHRLGRTLVEDLPPDRRRVDLRRLLQTPRAQVGALTGLGVVVGHLLAGPVGAVAGALAGPVATRVRRTHRAAARRDVLDRQLGEAVETIAASVRAGLSVRRAVAEAATEAAPPLREELAAVVHGLDTGEPLDAALRRLSARIALSDVGLVIGALSVHGRTGGDLPALLEAIRDVIARRRADRRTVRSLTAQARSSGVVLAVLPIAFVALLSGTGGDGLGAFYRSSTGASLLVGALGLEALGFAWMRRIVERVESG